MIKYAIQSGIIRTERINIPIILNNSVCFILKTKECFLFYHLPES